MQGDGTCLTFSFNKIRLSWLIEKLTIWPTINFLRIQNSVILFSNILTYIYCAGCLPEQ